MHGMLAESLGLFTSGVSSPWIKLVNYDFSENQHDQACAQPKVTAGNAAADGGAITVILKLYTS